MLRRLPFALLLVSMAGCLATPEATFREVPGDASPDGLPASHESGSAEADAGVRDAAPPPMPSREAGPAADAQPGQPPKGGDDAGGDNNGNGGGHPGDVPGSS